MKVLSLFDGISCGRVALERSGFTVSRYVAYEIDPDAITVSAWNWPDIEHKGNVEGADFTQYQGFDLLIGGSPCQDLSLAGNGTGLTGPRSRLFWEYVRAKKEVQPRRFLFENVASMKRKDRETITDALSVEPIEINSALVSAQKRKRLYWTNIQDVDQPEDRLVLISDVLEPTTYVTSRNDFIVFKSATKKGFEEIFPGQSYDATYPNSRSRRGRVMLTKARTITCKRYLGGGVSAGTIRYQNTNDCKPCQSVILIC